MIALVLCSLVAVGAGEPVQIAVLALEAKTGVTAEAASALTSALVAELARTPGVEAHAMEVLKAEAQRAVDSRDMPRAEAARTRLQKGVASPLMVSGTVGKLGSQLFLNITMINTRTAAPEGRVSLRTKDGEAGLIKQLPTAVKELLGTTVPAASAAPVKR